MKHAWTCEKKVKRLFFQFRLALGTNVASNNRDGEAPLRLFGARRYSRDSVLKEE